jgi:hypothetical protein
MLGNAGPAMKSIRFPKLNKLFEVMEMRGVKVFVHWSVLLIGAVILLGAFDDPSLAFAVLGAYYGVILLHECGHMGEGVQCGPSSYTQSGESHALANPTLDMTTAS